MRAPRGRAAGGQIMRKTIALWVAALAVAAASALATETPKQAGPYDPTLDGVKQLEAAAQRAATGNRRLLVIVGGNWCKWCRALDGVVHDSAQLRDELAAHWEVVHLNWSKENKNAPAMKRLGHPEELGFPAFVVASPKLEVLQRQETGRFEKVDADRLGYDTRSLLAVLKEWEPAK